MSMQNGTVAPLTRYNEGKRLHLERLRNIVPQELQDKFCTCKDYYGIAKHDDGIMYCKNCNLISFSIFFTSELRQVPDYAVIFTRNYNWLFPYSNHVPKKPTVDLFVYEIRDCPLCESVYVVPFLPYDAEFCPSCEAVS